MSLIITIIGTILSLVVIILVLKYKNSFDDVRVELEEIKDVKQYFDFCIIGFVYFINFRILKLTY